MVKQNSESPAKGGNGTAKPKAQKVNITQLLVTSAYAKTFSSGKGGFFGQALDPQTGKRYQIVGAVELGARA